MIKKDFHGLSYEDAMDEIHSIVGKVRSDGGNEQAELITGFGSIRSGAMGLLLTYGLSPNLGLSNQGKISVTIE